MNKTKTKNLNKGIVKEMKEFALVIIGTFITAFAFNNIIVPAGILSGGLTGIAQLINHVFPVNIGVLYLIMNIPLIILAYFYLGKKFVIYTIISTGLLSALLMYMPVKAIWTDDVLLSAIFGGVILAFGAGITLKNNGSQGGVDILARVVAVKSDYSIGRVGLVINGAIVTASGFLFGAEIALFTIVQLFCSAQMLDLVLNHVERRSVMIITTEGKKVNSLINKEINRGTTYWHGNGGYTEADKTIIFCVLTKGEIAKLKDMLEEVDEKAFVSVNSANQVIGRFNKVW